MNLQLKKDGCTYNCYLRNGAKGTFRLHCKPQGNCKPKTNLSGDVRKCLKKGEGPSGKLRCLEWTKNYRMVAPKNVVCYPEGERPPAAIGPIPEVSTTDLSIDEKSAVTIISKKETTIDSIATQMAIPKNDAAYITNQLELKGIIAQPKNNSFSMRKNAIPTSQTGLFHDYAHPSGGENIPAVYQIIEIQEVMPSHQALKDFAWSSGYPSGIQDRDYAKTSLPYQSKVLEKSATLDPARVISTGKTSVEGPPIVVGSGNFVLSGNSRALSITYASKHHPGKYKAYVNYLKEHAITYGLAPKAVQAMKQPMLVRRVAVPPTTYKVFASMANESPAMALDMIGTLQAVAKYVPDEIIMTLDIGDEETLRAYIASPRGQRFAKAIMNALPATKVGAYIDRGMLTEEGKALIDGVLFYKLLPDMEIIEHTPKQIRQTLSFAIPEFFRIKLGVQSGQMIDGWDLTKELPKAVEFYSRNLTETPLSFWLRQETLFEQEKKDVFEPDTIWGQLVVLIDKFGKSPRKFRDLLRNYASDAQQILATSDADPVDALTRLLSNSGNGGQSELFGHFALAGQPMDIFDVIIEAKERPVRRKRRRRRK